MKLGEFNVFANINYLGLDNSEWSTHFFSSEVSVKEQTGFGTDEKVEGFVLFIWIKDENEDDIVWFGINCKTPKYHLFDEGTKNHLLVYEFND